MASLFSYLLTATIALHAALGCCLHHAHSCETGCCQAPGPVVDGCPCHESGVEVAKSTGEAEAQSTDSAQWSVPPDRHTCQGDRCDFARTESALQRDIDVSIDVAILDHALWFEPLVLGTSPSLAQVDLGDSTPLQDRRLHLVLAIFLI